MKLPMENLCCRLVALTLVFAVFSALSAQASVVMGPQFYVKIEVTNLGVETLTRPDGSTYIQNFVEFKVLEFIQGSSSRIKIGDVIKHELAKSSVSLLKIGDELIAGVEIGSSMGAFGPVEFVIWSPIKRENGTDLLPFFS